MFYIYKRFISSPLNFLSKIFAGPNQGCRFTPTCSEYAKESIKKYGIIHGSWLALLRLLRCNPLFAGGHDPVL